MTKNYQTKTRDASALAMSEQVSVAMDEIAADMREALLALAVGAGLQVMAQLLEADVTAVCGPRASTTGSVRRPGTAPRRARSTWAGGGCR